MNDDSKGVWKEFLYPFKGRVAIGEFYKSVL
jgi:hypothetical protein